MEFCSDDHDQVAFTCNKCPVCEAKSEISDLEDKIKDLEADLDNALSAE